MNRDGVMDERGGIRHRFIHIERHYIWDFDSISYSPHYLNATDVIKNIFKTAEEDVVRNYPNKINQQLRDDEAELAARMIELQYQKCIHFYHAREG